MLATKVVARVRRKWSVRLTVRHMLQHPSLAALAALLDEETGTSPTPERTEEPPARTGPVPLTSQQRGMWLANEVSGLNVYFHMPLAVRITGPVDLGALADAVADLGARHEILRTVFPLDAGEPRPVLLGEPLRPATRAA